jgi:hypothetical protein
MSANNNNTDGKKQFLQFAIEAVEKNVSTRKTKKSINDSMFDLLYNQGEKLTRQELITYISYERYENEVAEIDDKIAKQLGTDKEWKRINKTVKNGLDTALCNGQTSASFCSNKKYDGYEIVLEANRYSIVKK